jgi:hypothetical protein
MFEDIHNTLANYLKIDLDWIKLVFLIMLKYVLKINGGLPNKMILLRIFFRCSYVLDYENITFWCQTFS